MSHLFASDPLVPTPSAPVVDVLVPAYNAEVTLAETLRSLTAQTLRDIRILVVNDGSTDRTSEVARELARVDPRIRVVDRPNGGITAARNTAVQQSSAPFLAMQDADDRSAPDRLERQLAYLYAHPDCVGVGGDVWLIDADGRRIGGRARFGGNAVGDLHALPSVEPYLPQSFLMVRRDAVIAAGSYREVTNAEDTDLYWRLLSFGNLYNLPEPVGEYRLHGASASSAEAHSGRLSAVNSQLAAISRQRSLSGQPDLRFTVDGAREQRALPDLRTMIVAAARQLSAAEADWLRFAAAAKLLELASYRPYLLSADDCLCICEALPTIRAAISGRERLLVNYRLAHVLGRLLRHRRWTAVRALGAGPAVYASLIPAAGARRIKALLHRVRYRGGG